MSMHIVNIVDVIFKVLRATVINNLVLISLIKSTQLETSRASLGISISSDLSITLITLTLISISLSPTRVKGIFVTHMRSD